MKEKALHACDQHHSEDKEEDMTELHPISRTSRCESITAESSCVEFELEMILSHNEHPVCFQNFGYETLLCNV